MPRSELALPAAETKRPPSRARTWLLGALSTLIALTAFAAGAAPQAQAITEADEMGRFGSPQGAGPGQLLVPFGIATDPVSGHVYVGDANARINEFTPWGDFVKAFGWDVAPGAVNEQQEVRIRAASGQFRLSFEAQTTADIAFDATAAEVQAALEGLAAIGAGDVAVETTSGTPDGLTPYLYFVTFKGALAGADVAELQASQGTTALAGGIPSTTLEARTRADGTPGGTGLESCTAESGCKAGVPGAGAGQLQNPTGIATDEQGNVYVKDPENQRVQKYDSAGRFVWMVGGGVNVTTGEDICTAASGNECGAGSAGSGPREFEGGLGIASGPGAIYVADDGRIQELGLDGSYAGEVPVSGATVGELARDPVSGDFYALLVIGGATQSNVRRLDGATGAEKGALAGTSSSVAVDSAGNVFAAGSGSPRRVVEFDSAGKKSDEEFGEVEGGFPIEASIRAIGLNPAGTVYVGYYAPGADSFVRFFGAGPTRFEAPPAAAPEIAAQYATSVGRSEAIVGAEINPFFWTDTRYYMQYGTGKCSEGGCTVETPVAPGASLTSKATNKPVKTAAVVLEGLADDTTYHYRFVAESSGGGPTVGEEASFTTYPKAPPRPACPNDALRSGFSSRLPDCRAFEMVSPLDKNNGDILAGPEVAGYPTDFTQGAGDGSRFTFSSLRSFADPASAPYTSQYLASRQGGGWSTESLSVPHGPAATGSSNFNFLFQNEFKAFSDDLCHAWQLAGADPVLAPGAPEGYFELYRRDNCGPLAYEALAKAQPSGLVEDYNPEMQGISADSSTAVFRVKEQLTAQGSVDKLQAYYAKDGALSLLCILPNGTPSASNCSAGTARNTFLFGNFQTPLPNRTASVANALSADGSRAYWTASEDKTGAGTIYLRLNPGEPQSASGCEAGLACTLPVSETKSNRASIFLGASTDGTRALFQVVEGPAAGKLYLYEVGAPTREIALASLDFKPDFPPNAAGILGMSDSLSYVYFVSEQALPGTSGASAGEPNLYLDHEGAKTFIATLGDVDVYGEPTFVEDIPTNTAFEPFYHLARAAADGTSLVFMSSESLTGYDNVDQRSGRRDSEVYLYDASADVLRCVSCNPSGARPRGEEVKYALGREGSPSTQGDEQTPVAALIRPVTYQLQHVRPLSADGSRLFFDSYDALLPADTNGARDVYEWRAAENRAQCDALGAGLYSAGAGGCISLISSGESPEDSVFLDATPSGGDVFFSTSASLVSQDPGLIDVYDARVAGGFPTPQGPAPCEGESCQGSSTPPNDPALSSATFKGAGNATPPRRCRKGRVARGGRCVAKRKRKAQGQKRHKTHRKANRDGRTGR